MGRGQELNTNERREIRTPNLVIWSQTRYRCAIQPLMYCFGFLVKGFIHYYFLQTPPGHETSIQEVKVRFTGRQFLLRCMEETNCMFVQFSK